MQKKIKSVRGVSDILPSEIGIWQWIENNARSMLETFGYKEIRTPMFEQTDLFIRSIGEETDIVSKEMYTFPDRKGQLLSLRPEGTAPVVRAYLQHNLHLDPRGYKLYYIGPMFRYERPQAGRTRQFHQIGAECFGPSEPEVDTEQIILIYHLLRKLWMERDSSAFNRDSKPFRVHLNTLGCPSCRAEYHRLLREQISNLVPLLCEDCKKRYDLNILRVLDCKNPECKGLIEDAPSMMDNLCADCEKHFNKVKGLLDEAKVPYILDPYLVRGLDYYTRTTFEFTSHLLGAQNAIAGGGRYDLLVEDFGGAPTPACGFALGMERLILALNEISQKDKAAPSLFCFCFMAHIGMEAQKRAFALVNMIRLMGVPIEMSYQPSSLKSKMKQADRFRAVYTLILGQEEISGGRIILRHMKTGEQEEYPMDQIPDILYQRYVSWIQGKNPFPDPTSL